MTDTEKVGEIHITVSSTDVQYETEFDLPEVIFWLETLKSMVIKKILEDQA